jgi:hypothetical protein
VPRRTLVRILNSEFIRDLYSTTTGTTAVTKAGLTALPLPNPHALKGLGAGQRTRERAIRTGFGARYTIVRGDRAHAKATTT